MRRNKQAARGLIALIFLALAATIVYDQIKLHREPVQYQLDIHTEDFEINNINLVSSL